MKRTVALLSALLLTAVAGFTGNLFGDANGDGRVDMADVVAVVNAAMGNDPDNFDEAMADINGNGKIDEEDASLLAESLLNPPFDRTKALEDDYERAFTQGYLPMKYSARYRKQQVTSQEFKALLKLLVEEYNPDKMEYFNSKITDYDAPVYKGLAACMVWYVARCIGVDTNNSTLEHSSVEDIFDNLWDLPAFTDIMPYAFSPLDDDVENKWDEAIHAILWNASHVSNISGIEIVGFDKEDAKWSWNKPFTWEDAVRAITRLYDSFEPEIVYASIDDPRVTTPDASIITPELIAYAAKKEIHDIKDLPRQIGFFCGEGNGDLTQPWRFGTTAKDIKEWASWGFNSLKYVPSWRHLFNNDMEANLSVFKSLDEMVAAAMEYGVHLYFGFCAVPGYGMYWAENFRDDYIMDTDILNPEKRQKAVNIWKAIATRYKDVPNVNLSFCPIQEITALYSPDGFGEGQSFTPEQILDFVDIMVDAIKEVTPERFIFYDAFCFNLPTKNNDLMPMAQQQYKHMTEKYKNTRLVNNHMDMGYMFYEYSQGDGNIDWAHHSVWVPTYPITLYDANSMIHDDNMLTIDGCLPEGTSIDFYIADADNATMIIAADSKTLYEETLNGDFNMGYANAWGEQFKKSDKKVTVTLNHDTKKVVLSASAGIFNWCGIEVKLPKSYTVSRWWKPSGWDVELGLITEEEVSQGWTMKPTSSVQIGSFTKDWDGGGLNITIKDDVTFTSDHYYSISNKEITEQMVKEVCENFPKWSCRFEDVLVTDMAGALNYWDETLEIFQRYNIDVWISAIGLLSEEQLAPFRICDYEGEDFEGHHNFNVKLLKVLQKYMDK